MSRRWEIRREETGDSIVVEPTYKDRSIWIQPRRKSRSDSYDDHYAPFNLSREEAASLADFLTDWLEETDERSNELDMKQVAKNLVQRAREYMEGKTVRLVGDQDDDRDQDGSGSCAQAEPDEP